MRMAVSKDLREINFDNKTLSPAPPPESEWIKFDDIWDQTTVAAATTQAADDGETKAKVEVLELNEKTEKIRNAQVSFEKSISKASPIEVRWKAWHEQNQFMGATHADKACVIGMLENIHSRWDVSAGDVKVMLRDGKAFAVAATSVTKGPSCYPPASPKQVGCTI